MVPPSQSGLFPSNISNIKETSTIDQDAQHLQLLSVFHYVVGGLMALFGCFPIIHLTIGIVLVTGEMDDGNGPPPEIGWIFIVAAVVAITFMWAVAIAVVVAGRKLAARTAYTYCLVVAAIECLFVPFGTVLGVFSIIVLMRPSVKELFGVTGNSTPDTQAESGA